MIILLVVFNLLFYLTWFFCYYFEIVDVIFIILKCFNIIEEVNCKEIPFHKAFKVDVSSAGFRWLGVGVPKPKPTQLSDLITDNMTKDEIMEQIRKLSDMRDKAMHRKLNKDPQVSFLRKYIVEEKKRIGCYERIGISFEKYIESVNFNIMEYENKYKYWSNKYLINKFIIEKKEYVSNLYTIFDYYFFSNQGYLSAAENEYIIKFCFELGRYYNVTSDEIGILLKFKRIHTQKKIPFDFDFSVAVYQLYKDIQRMEKEPVDLRFLTELYEIMLIKKKEPHSLLESTLFEDDNLDLLIKAKRELNDQFDFWDLMLCFEYRNSLRVSSLKTYEWSWYRKYCMSWAIPDIVYVERNCVFPKEELFKGYFWEKIKSDTRRYIVYRFILLHQELYAQFGTYEFIQMMLWQKDYPNTLELCRALKNIDLAMSMDQIKDILELDKKYNKSRFQSWWYYFTGRKYSAGQLLEIWTQLRSSEWSSIDNIEERERRVLDYLLKNKFKSFTEVDDIRYCSIRHYKKWW